MQTFDIAMFGVEKLEGDSGVEDAHFWDIYSKLIFGGGTPYQMKQNEGVCIFECD